MNRLALAIGFLFCLWPTPLLAAGRQPAPLAALFAASATEFGLAETWLTAIAKVESGLNPWAVNVAGRSYSCRSKEEVLAVAQAAQTAGQSFDLGLMQINCWWLKKYGLSLEVVLEPATNIRFGSWILKQELERWGDLRRAVGAYHSPQPGRANAYADRVLAALQPAHFIQATSNSISNLNSQNYSYVDK